MKKIIILQKWFLQEGKYFISIGMGKIELDEEVIYCISLASPIGKVLRDKKTGDEIQFNNADIAITDIL